MVPDRWGGTYLWVNGPPVYVAGSARDRLSDHHGEHVQLQVRRAAFPKVEPATSSWRIDKARLLAAPSVPSSRAARHLELTVQATRGEGELAGADVAAGVADEGSRRSRGQAHAWGPHVELEGTGTGGAGPLGGQADSTLAV